MTSGKIPPHTNFPALQAHWDQLQQDHSTSSPASQEEAYHKLLEHCRVLAEHHLDSNEILTHIETILEQAHSTAQHAIWQERFEAELSRVRQWKRAMALIPSSQTPTPAQDRPQQNQLPPASPQHVQQHNPRDRLPRTGATHLPAYHGAISEALHREQQIGQALPITYHLATWLRRLADLFAHYMPFFFGHTSSAADIEHHASLLALLAPQVTETLATLEDSEHQVINDLLEHLLAERSFPPEQRAQHCAAFWRGIHAGHAGFPAEKSFLDRFAGLPQERFNDLITQHLDSPHTARQHTARNIQQFKTDFAATIYDCFHSPSARHLHNNALSPRHLEHSLLRHLVQRHITQHGQPINAQDYRTLKETSKNLAQQLFDAFQMPDGGAATCNESAQCATQITQDFEAKLVPTISSPEELERIKEQCHDLVDNQSIHLIAADRVRVTAHLNTELSKLEEQFPTLPQQVRKLEQRWQQHLNESMPADAKPTPTQELADIQRHSQHITEELEAHVSRGAATPEHEAAQATLRAVRPNITALHEFAQKLNQAQPTAGYDHLAADTRQAFLTVHSALHHEAQTDPHTRTLLVPAWQHWVLHQSAPQEPPLSKAEYLNASLPGIAQGNNDVIAQHLHTNSFTSPLGYHLRYALGANTTAQRARIVLERRYRELTHDAEKQAQLSSEAFATHLNAPHESWPQLFPHLFSGPAEQQEHATNLLNMLAALKQATEHLETDATDIPPHLLPENFTLADSTALMKHLLLQEWQHSHLKSEQMHDLLILFAHGLHHSKQLDKLGKLGDALLMQLGPQTFGQPLDVAASKKLEEYLQLLVRIEQPGRMLASAEHDSFCSFQAATAMFEQTLGPKNTRARLTTFKPSSQKRRMVKELTRALALEYIVKNKIHDAHGLDQDAVVQHIIQQLHALGIITDPAWHPAQESAPHTHTVARALQDNKLWERLPTTNTMTFPATRALATTHASRASLAKQQRAARQAEHASALPHMQALTSTHRQALERSTLSAIDKLAPGGSQSVSLDRAVHVQADVPTDGIGLAEAGAHAMIGTGKALQLTRGTNHTYTLSLQSGTAGALGLQASLLRFAKAEASIAQQQDSIIQIEFQDQDTLKEYITRIFSHQSHNIDDLNLNVTFGKARQTTHAAQAEVAVTTRDVSEALPWEKIRSAVGAPVEAAEEEDDDDDDAEEDESSTAAAITAKKMRARTNSFYSDPRQTVTMEEDHNIIEFTVAVGKQQKKRTLDITTKRTLTVSFTAIDPNIATTVQSKDIASEWQKLPANLRKLIEGTLTDVQKAALTQSPALKGDDTYHLDIQRTLHPSLRAQLHTLLMQEKTTPAGASKQQAQQAVTQFLQDDKHYYVSQIQLNRQTTQQQATKRFKVQHNTLTQSSSSSLWLHSYPPPAR